MSIQKKHRTNCIVTIQLPNFDSKNKSMKFSGKLETLIGLISTPFLCIDCLTPNVNVDNCKLWPIGTSLEILKFDLRIVNISFFFSPLSYFFKKKTGKNSSIQISEHMFLVSKLSIRNSNDVKCNLKNSK